MNKNLKCPDCGRALHCITTDDIVEVGDYVLLIKDIPLMVCAYPECETKFHTGDVLQKKELLIQQFKRQTTNAFFSNREVVVTYPKSLFSHT